MTEKTRRTVTTIETHEVWIIKKRAAEGVNVLCAVCPGEVEMLPPQEAARQAGVSQRTVYRWVDEGRIHFAESTEGNLFVCLAPLVVDLE